MNFFEMHFGGLRGLVLDLDPSKFRRALDNYFGRKRLKCLKIEKRLCFGHPDLESFTLRQFNISRYGSVAVFIFICFKLLYFCQSLFSEMNFQFLHDID